MPDGSLPDVQFFPATTPGVFVDHNAHQVLSLEPEGDVFYGLIPGTNGTAAITRRLCAAPDGYEWIASDCRKARGVFVVPSNRSDGYQTNPWSGRC
jgi:hypothetical protein